MHYMELHVRHLAREGWGSVKSLHPEHRIEIRSVLGRFSKQLEVFRRKWVAAEQLIMVKQNMVLDALQCELGKASLAQGELDKLRQLSSKVAELSLEHKDLPGLIMPAPKPMPQPRALRQKSVKTKLDKWTKPGIHPELLPKWEEFPVPVEEFPVPVGEIGPQHDEDLWNHLVKEEGPPTAQPSSSSQQAKALEQADLVDLTEPVEAAEPGEQGDPLQQAEPVGAAKIGEPTEAVEQAEPVEAAKPGQPTEAVEQAGPGEGSGWIHQELGELVELTAGSDLQPPAEEDVTAMQEKLQELESGELSFEVWVKTSSEDQKHMVLRQHLGQAEKWVPISKYLIYVKATETHQGCGKCRYRSCEKCSYSKAQNYALRNADTPVWFKRLKKGCLSAF